MVYTALYDACVLYPFSLRDLLIELAGTNLFRAKWSEMINKEWVNNLCSKYFDLKPERLEKTVRLMNQAIQDANISGFEALIPELSLPDPQDNHVLAAAIHGKVNVIVTFNLKDFPQEYLRKFDIEAQHPDEFIVNLLELDYSRVCLCIKMIRQRLNKPVYSASALLDRYEQVGLVQTAAVLRRDEYLL